MSDTMYNSRHYVKFTADEFLQMLVTSAFVGVILGMRDLLFEHFMEVRGVQTLLFMFIFSLFALLIVVWVCKIVAVRLGYTLEYRSHYLGLMLGTLITFATAGYLPLFIPGGFEYSQPERLRIGKWHGFRKSWEVGLIAASFPLAMIGLVLLISPLYIFTKADLYLQAMIAVILFALFACIPAPGVIVQHSGRAMDWFRYLRGTTFGLDIAFVSRYWWMALCFTIIVFWGMAYLLTLFDTRVGLLVYAFSIIMGAFVLWIYHLFFKE